MLARHGLDPARDLLPVAPALHYAMGGIQTDLEGRATVPGSGPSARWPRTGVHGANRLASNSLLEGLVFADRAGRALADDGANGEPPAVPAADVAVAARHRRRRRAASAIRQEMRELMTADVGVQRTEASLLHAEQELDAAHAARRRTAAWRTRNQLLVARLITQAARRRRESRGGHRRLDYPPGLARNARPR